MSDTDREKLIATWQVILDLETDRKMKTLARWQLRALQLPPPDQTDSQSAVPERAGRPL